MRGAWGTPGERNKANRLQVLAFGCNGGGVAPTGRAVVWRAHLPEEKCKLGLTQ